MGEQLRPNQKRFPVIDMARGIAIVLMVYFHFCYDLSHFGLLEADFYNSSYWVNLRSAIVTLFMLLVGVSLVLAASKESDKRLFWRRITLLSCFAFLITLVTYFLFPGRAIYFGVLHFIVFARVVASLFIHFKWINLTLGLGIIVLGSFYQNAWFDAPAVHWLGMMTYKPFTEDYAPVFPWFGVVLVGMFVGQLSGQSEKLGQNLSNEFTSHMPRFLCLMGRHSLLIYLTHQIILFPLIAGIAWLF